MKSQTPPNWSPALKPRDAKDAAIVEPFGSGLTEMGLQSEQDPPPVNQTMYQSFEWHTPSWSTSVTKPENLAAHDIVDPSSTATTTTTKPNFVPHTLPSHYSLVSSLLPTLSSLGITSMWLPPGCKGTNPRDNGYGIYDLYDLGEFDWKGSRATKWGSKEELLQLGNKAKEVGIGLLWDAVLNHRAAADEKEGARAIVSHSKDRTIDVSPARDVVTWTKFTYPARNKVYSSMTYTWQHFSGIDWDDLTHSKSILKFTSDHPTLPKPGWSSDVDTSELGNYDYLMFADVDYSQPDVQADVLYWSTWLASQVPGLQGMRLDAIKHYSARFQYALIKHLRENPSTKDWFFVGEYWRPDSAFLARHIDRFAGHLHLFDVKLMYNFSDFSHARLKDLRTVFSGSLVELKPQHAVTFVTNHDTQATQSLAAPVLPWFQAHAYALILLRSTGYPCIFHGDIVGTLGPASRPPAAGNRLMRLCLARKQYAYGPQHDFFDKRECIGWTREGHRAHSAGAGLAVVVSTAWSWRAKRMFVGRKHAAEVWTDLMGWSWDAVVIDRAGWGVFRVGPRGVGVWTSKDAVGRNTVDRLVWPPLPGEDDRSADVVGSGGDDRSDALGGAEQTFSL